MNDTVLRDLLLEHITSRNWGIYLEDYTYDNQKAEPEILWIAKCNFSPQTIRDMGYGDTTDTQLKRNITKYKLILSVGSAPNRTKQILAINIRRSGGVSVWDTYRKERQVAIVPGNFGGFIGKSNLEILWQAA